MSAEAPFTGMHAVVTGGGRGIGRAIAARLAGLGASLTLLGRDPTRLDDVAKSLRVVKGASDSFERMH